MFYRHNRYLLCIQRKLDPVPGLNIDLIYVILLLSRIELVWCVLSEWNYMVCETLPMFEFVY